MLFAVLSLFAASTVQRLISAGSDVDTSHRQEPAAPRRGGPLDNPGRFKKEGRSETPAAHSRVTTQKLPTFGLVVRVLLRRTGRPGPRLSAQ